MISSRLTRLLLNRQDRVETALFDPGKFRHYRASAMETKGTAIPGPGRRSGTGGGALGPRLEAVAELVPDGSVVADVGSDHGLLPAALLARGWARRCVASDRNRGRIDRFPVADGLEVRHGPGLGVLRAEDGIEVLTLCGMGARTMLAILGDDRLAALGIRRLVLQPQTEPARLRRWLRRAGWRILAERFVRERGYGYTVISAERGVPFAAPHPTLSPDDLCEAGPCLVRDRDPRVIAHWRGELRRLERIAAGGPTGADGARVDARIRLARRILAALASDEAPPSRLV
jgi:tRNA (adenine22-N1)-methyltransferase